MRPFRRLAAAGGSTTGVGRGFVLGVILALMLSPDLGTAGSLRAMEHVTLRNGFELDCERREVVGEKVRLYLVPAEMAGAEGGAAGGGLADGIPDGANYLEVEADAVVRVEPMAARVATDLVGEKQVGEKQGLRSAQGSRSAQRNKVGTGGGSAVRLPASAMPTAMEMREMLAHAGIAHRVDEDLLASVVRAESGGRVLAVSRVGAQGLMQLMPTTAAAMGVKDAFQAEQNIDGGSAYLDWLLTRYHDDMARALAAYNAGPAAVDRYHGVPPYRETRAYVARVIREFNRRKIAEMVAAR